MDLVVINDDCLHVRISLKDLDGYPLLIENFPSPQPDSESEVDFAAEGMTDNLVEINTSLQLDDDALVRFVEMTERKTLLKNRRAS